MFDKKEDEKKPAAAGAKAAETAPPRRPAVTIRYLDRPDCLETFADSLTRLSFDGQTLRLEFAVTRMDVVKPNAPVTGRRYPVCRLVLQPLAAVDLIQPYTAGRRRLHQGRRGQGHAAGRPARQR